MADYTARMQEASWGALQLGEKSVFLGSFIAHRHPWLPPFTSPALESSAYSRFRPKVFYLLRGLFLPTS